MVNVIQHRPLYLESGGNKPRRPDYVRMIEAAYARKRDDRRWLEGILRAVRPVLDQGHGVFGWVNAFGDERLTVGAPVFIDCPVGLPDAMTARAKRVPPEILWRYITASPCAPASACEPESMSEGREASLREFGLRDIIYVRGLGPDHSGCVLAAGTAGRVLHPRQIAAMSRVGAHVAAAFRLRRNRGQVPEAIFDGRGRLVHAEGAATGRRHRDLLASAVTAVERSRGPLRRRDPEEAVALWRALVADRWSLVERFEADGRRFLLARVNVPEVAAPLVLTPAERRVAALLALGHPQKLVCYELGVSSSTVSTLAASALRKLGFASRAELIRLLGARRS